MYIYIYIYIYMYIPCGLRSNFDCVALHLVYF